MPGWLSRFGIALKQHHWFVWLEHTFLSRNRMNSTLNHIFGRSCEKSKSKWVTINITESMHKKRAGGSGKRYNIPPSEGLQMGGLCPFPNLRIREITPLRAASSIRLKKDPCTRSEEVEPTRFQTSIFTVEKKERVQTKLLVQTKEYHYR